MVVGYPPYNHNQPVKMKIDKLQREILYPNTISSEIITLIKMLTKIDPESRVTNIETLSSYSKQYFGVDMNIIQSNRFHYNLLDEESISEPRRFYKRRPLLPDGEEEFPLDDYSPEVVDKNQLSYHTVDLSHEKYTSTLEGRTGKEIFPSEKQEQVRILDEFVYFKQEDHFEFDNLKKMNEIMEQRKDQNITLAHKQPFSKISGFLENQKPQITQNETESLEIGIIDLGTTNQILRDNMIDLSQHERSNDPKYKKWRFRVDDIGNKVPRRKIF